MSIIHGPSAAALAWIPYFVNTRRMSPNAYTSVRGMRRLAYSLLLDSGNTFDNNNDRERQYPLESFADYTAFLDFLAEKNYRGAMYLRDVQLECDDQNRPQKISFWHIEDVGYTPMKVGYSLEREHWKIAASKKKTLFYMRGAGGVMDGGPPETMGKPEGGIKKQRCYIIWRDNCVIIRQWIRFKIGRIGNYGSYLLTGHWAPSAWMEIYYQICCDRKVRIDFGGSHLPSQTFYVHWSRVGLHDMLQNTEKQISGFIEAGDCKDAPGTFFYSWPEKGQALFDWGG